MSQLKPIFIILLLSFSCSLLSQGQEDGLFDKIDFERKKVKKKFTKSPDILARELTEGIHDEASKVYAMCDWISHHIHYDLKGFVRRRVYSRSSEEVLKRNKALCGEYAELFNDMCQSVGIASETVSGYTLDDDHFPEDTLYRAEHAWTVVKVNKEWRLIDLTYGSGYLIYRKQWLRKLLWRYLNIQYVKKLKYVHEFNPTWFDVSPAQMIKSHFPVMPMNQLLSPPLSIEEFYQAQWENEKRTELTGSFELDKFHSSDQLTKWRSIGAEGYKSNPANHRLPGICAFLVADSLYKKDYVPEGKMLSGSNQHLLVLDSLCAFADSCLLLSKRDNRTEYNTRVNRSRQWKMDLKEKNSVHRSALSDRRRMNAKQVNEIHRIERKLRSSKRYAQRWSRQTKAHRIERTTRPKSKANQNLSLIHSLFNEVDSLQQIDQRLLGLRDSIMSVYTEDDQMQVVELEKDNKRGHKRNNKALRSYLRGRYFYFPLIHLDDSWIEKRWFAAGHEALNQANLLQTDTLIKGLYLNLKTVTDSMKVYNQVLKTQLAHLKKIKRNSFDDRQEVMQYVQLVEKHHQELNQFHELCREYMHIRNKVERSLLSSKGIFKSSRRMLKKDDQLERVRYNHYRAKKRFVQRAEDRRIALYRDRLKEMMMILKRSKRARQIEASG